MGMSNHTPGPWTVTEHYWSDTAIYDSDGEVVASLSICDDATEDNQEELEKRMGANARLISCAPEMYEELKLSIADIDAMIKLHWNAQSLNPEQKEEIELNILLFNKIRLNRLKLIAQAEGKEVEND